MIYILLGLLIMLLASFFIYKMRTGDKHAHAAVKAGGLVTILLFMLRLAPNMLGNLLLFGPALIHMLRPQAKADISSKVSEAEMTVEEARQILEVSSTASAAEISAAFKKMMLKNHPDQGGSRYIAEQLIRAKEILLNQTR